jgi:predicted ABC-class ATPase
MEKSTVQNVSGQIESFISFLTSQQSAFLRHYECVEDQNALRNLIAESGAIAFVANGSILPRKSSDSELKMSNAIPFQSPQSLEREFSLPHFGCIRGMCIPPGVTVITGGGFHGKSTLLRALSIGCYDKVPGK